MKKPGRLVVCSRGHEFYKNSDCPVCPKCWSGYYRKRHQSDFPAKLSAPALRGLLGMKIKKLSDLSVYSESEISQIHGVGPNALALLKKALKAEGMSFVKK